jgi:hypothetical protein|tara:strand:- start:2252 stop:2767 length:516 start_codon:yes stop_codon:yes gene_type:complete
MKNKLTIFLILFNFALGIYAGLFVENFYSTKFAGNVENPEENAQETITRLAPHNRIEEEDIAVFDDRIVIDLKSLKGRKTSWSTYADSGSMKPTLGKGCNGLEFVPKTPQEIYEGDIIAFSKNGGLVVHRVIKTGYDAEGWFAIAQGDNNEFSDGKVRFHQTEYITYAIIC